MSLIRKVVIASAVGNLAGVLIGVISIYGIPANAPGRSGSHTAATATRSDIAVVSPVPPRRADPPQPIDSDAVLRRARALASAADVRGLIGLREDTLREAAGEGRRDVPETKGLVAEIDRALAKAQAMRLALDRQEFLKEGQGVETVGTAGRPVH